MVNVPLETCCGLSRNAQRVSLRDYKFVQLTEPARKCTSLCSVVFRPIDASLFREFLNPRRIGLLPLLRIPLAPFPVNLPFSFSIPNIPCANCSIGTLLAIGSVANSATIRSIELVKRLINVAPNTLLHHLAVPMQKPAETFV